MTNAKQEAAQRSYAAVVTRAWEDPVFKKQLILDPKNAIESIKGSELHVPSGKEIKIVDQSDDKYIYINIPKRPEMKEMELSDKQLDEVSGGRAYVPWKNWWWNPPKIFW